MTGPVHTSQTPDEHDLHPAVPCLVCGRAMSNAFPGSRNQPDGGLAFVSYGHYGSTAFDPMTGDRLDISVCDPCVVSAARSGRVSHATPGPAGPVRPSGSARSTRTPSRLTPPAPGP